MLNHLSNSNGTLSMESISEIIDHQTLSRQLVEDTSDLMVQHSLVGRTPSPASSVTALSSHEAMVEENDVATSSSVVLSSDTDERNNMVIVHTIIDQHSSTYETQRIPHQHPLHHQHQLQQQHLCMPHRLQLQSPVNFAASDNTLDALSVGSTSSNAMGHIIAVKQEHKLVIVNGNSNGSNNNNNNINNICNNHKHNNNSISSEHNKNNCNLEAVLDEFTPDDHSTMDSTDQHNYEALDVHIDPESHHNHHHHSSIQLHHHHHHLHEQQRSQHNTPSSHNEPLTVIVQNHEDSHDSTTQILSPPELGVVGAGENSLGTSSYQTLTSVVNDEPLSPPGFSPTSAYATLTPLQPLPPISTMSEKFAYGGHVSGGGVINNPSSSNTANDDGVGNNTSNGSSGVVGPYVVLPTSHHSHSHNHHQHNQHHQNSLSSLSLSGLSGGEPSPYSSFDKLPSMGMSITPPHNYGSSPSHALSAIVSCDLPPTSPSGCGSLSPQSAFSHSSEVQTPPPSQSSLTNCKDSSCTKSNISINDNNNSGTASTIQHRDIVRLSPVTINGSRIIGDHVIVTGYDSPYRSQQRDLIVATTPSSLSSSHLHIQPHSPEALSLHSVSASSMPSPSTVVTLPHMSSNGTISSLATTSTRDLLGLASLQRNSHQHVVSLTPSPPLPSTTLPDMPQTTNHASVTNNCETTSINNRRLMFNGSSSQTTQPQQQSSKSNSITSDFSNNSQQQSHIAVHNQQQQVQPQHQQHDNEIQHQSSKNVIVSSANAGSHTGAGGGGDIEEINTKELAQRISAELKRYSIPQAIFAQRVLCRSQGTLSDLLRNPKPWSKLKSGRETFRRMFKWLQEPEFQRMSALRMAAAQIPQRTSTGGTNNGTGNELNHHIVNNSAHEDFDLDFTGTNSLVSTGTGSGTGTPGLALVTTSASCRRKDEPQMEHMPQPKKPRLVFTDLQRRTLQAIFKETKRPSKEMQVTIARQLGLEPTTVGNFFMNARRRSMDKWRDDDGNMVSNSSNKIHQTNANSTNHHSQHGQQDGNHFSSNGNNNRNNINNMQVQFPSSQHQHHHHHHSSSLDLDDDGDIDLDLVHDDFELTDDNIDDTQQQKDDDML